MSAYAQAIERAAEGKPSPGLSDEEWRAHRRLRLLTEKVGRIARGISRLNDQLTQEDSGA